MSGWSRRATKRIEAETDLAKGKPVEYDVWVKPTTDSEWEPYTKRAFVTMADAERWAKIYLRPGSWKVQVRA